MDWNRFKSNRQILLGLAVFTSACAAIAPLVFMGEESRLDPQPGETVTFLTAGSASPSSADVVAREGELVSDPQLPEGWPTDEPYFVPADHVYVGMRRSVGHRPKWDYSAVPRERVIRSSVRPSLTAKAPMAIVR
jgi:hypothetical protein